RLNYWQYREELRDVPGIRVLPYDETELCNYQYVVLEVDERDTRISRDQLLQVLWAENVIARRYFYPGCHRMEPYRTRYPDAGSRLPVTERLADRVLLVPTGTAVGPEEIASIGRIIRTAVQDGAGLSRRLAERTVLDA